MLRLRQQGGQRWPLQRDNIQSDTEYKCWSQLFEQPEKECCRQREWPMHRPQRGKLKVILEGQEGQVWPWKESMRRQCGEERGARKGPAGHGEVCVLCKVPPKGNNEMTYVCILKSPRRSLESSRTRVGVILLQALRNRRDCVAQYEAYTINLRGVLKIKQ